MAVLSLENKSIEELVSLYNMLEDELVERGQK